MKLTVTPNIIGALGTVTKGLEQGLEDLKIKGREETTQTTALLRLARILRRVLGRLDETYCHSDYSGKPFVNAGIKKLLKEFNNYNTNNNP